MKPLNRSELLALKWDDIDLDAGLLRVERNATEADAPCSEDCAPGCPGGKVHIGEPKTEKGTRTVSLGPDNTAPVRQSRGPTTNGAMGFRRHNGRGSDELRSATSAIAE